MQPLDGFSVVPVYAEHDKQKLRTFHPPEVTSAPHSSLPPQTACLLRCPIITLRTHITTQKAIKRYVTKDVGMTNRIFRLWATIAPGTTKAGASPCKWMICNKKMFSTQSQKPTPSGNNIQ